MALAFAAKTAGSGGYNTGTSTASVSWAAGEAVVIHLVCDGNDTPSSVTATGLTFSQVGSTQYNASWGHSLVSYRAVAAGAGSGAITFAWAGPHNYCWSVDGGTGQDTTYGTPGGNTGTLLVTLGAFAGANNRALSAFSIYSGGTTFTVGSGFTALSNNWYAGIGLGLMVQYGAANDNTCDASGNTASHCAAVAIEFKEASGGGGADTTKGGLLLLRNRLVGSHPAFSGRTGL